MGNRAVIAFKSSPTIGIYIHWNGGAESVLAFLDATKEGGARSPGSDPSYAFARLAQTIADFFPDGLSVGAGPIVNLDTDNGDNGLYWIGPNWEIAHREHTRSVVKTVEALTKGEREKYEGIKATLLRVRAARVAAYEQEAA